jgi:hypothetical protein
MIKKGALVDKSKNQRLIHDLVCEIAQARSR